MKYSKASDLIISACLAGVPCRYNGGTCARPELKKLVDCGAAIPVCPEELGGLVIPRPPAEIQGDRVINKAGEDVTAEFQRGARAVLKIAQENGISRAILKERSPSCGSCFIYDGSFTRAVIPGEGVTTALLRRNGITVQAEDDYVLAPPKNEKDQEI